MGTTKRRQAKRNDSRQTALTFLSNITLGNEHEIQKLSAVGSTTIESPTTAQYTDNCTSPTTPASRKRPSLTEYGTLSMSKNSAAKGLIKIIDFIMVILTYNYCRILSRFF